jgi:hypothetical protein
LSLLTITIEHRTNRSIHFIRRSLNPRNLKRKSCSSSLQIILYKTHDYKNFPLMLPWWLLSTLVRQIFLRSYLTILDPNIHAKLWILLHIHRLTLFR